MTTKQRQRITDAITKAGLNHPQEYMPYPYLFMESRTSANHADFESVLNDLVTQGRFVVRDGEYNSEYKIAQ